MVEPLLHFAVPFASLQALGLDWRKAAVASAIALTPDLDVFFLVHRSLSHSAVVPAAVALALMAFTFLIPIGKRRTVRSVILLGAFGVSTHLLLDLLTDYTPILWPLLNYSFFISIDLQLRMGSLPMVTGSVELLAEPTVFEPFTSLDVPVLTGEGVSVFLILLIPSIVRTVRNRASGNIQPEL